MKINQKGKHMTEDKLLLARVRMKEKGYSLAGYARANGLNVVTFRMFLRGKWTSANGEVGGAIRAALVRDGFLD